ncbi:MAG TPA: EAL domain-containing protein, partial [Ilumatobacter sp.]|nr:EAL domain-containing protein [Ilumatobacter sp.]
REPNFAERVIEVVEQQQIEPRSVMFEISESMLVDEGERADLVVEQLRHEGFRFAIDDFGSGHCSLSQLQKHPVDLLKIDRAVIAEFGRDPSGNTLTRAILQMAESLRLETVAEGIETTDQLRELRQTGCDLGQGYLLCQPLEADALARRFGQIDVVAAS